jgi:hypothetical protein
MQPVYRYKPITAVQVGDKIRDVSGAFARQHMEVLGKYHTGEIITLALKHSTGTIERSYDYPLARANVLEPRYLLF